MTYNDFIKKHDLKWGFQYNIKGTDKLVIDCIVAKSAAAAIIKIKKYMQQTHYIKSSCTASNSTTLERIFIM